MNLQELKERFSIGYLSCQYGTSRTILKRTDKEFLAYYVGLREAVFFVKFNKMICFYLRFEGEQYNTENVYALKVLDFKQGLKIINEAKEKGYEQHIPDNLQAQIIVDEI